MKKLFFSTTLLLLGATIQAQISHNVQVNNFSFIPAELTIQAGDTVIWTNIQGFHNVGTAAFPDNPESFGNEVTAAEWTYMYVFTLPGTNLYQCDAHPGPMQGSVTVSVPSISANLPNRKVAIHIFPNPVTDVLRWTLNDFQLPADTYFSLFDLTGKTVAQFKMNNSSFYDISHLSRGIYYYEIKEGLEQIQTGKLLVQTR